MNFHENKDWRIYAIEQFYIHGDKTLLAELPDADKVEVEVVQTE